MVEALEELHKPAASEDTAEVLLVLHMGPAGLAEEGNVPVQAQRKDRVVVVQVGDGRPVERRTLVVVVAKGLQVECCWHKDMELLAVNADSYLAAHL